MEVVFMYSFNEVSSFDPDLAKAMDDELARQRSHIELIASENLVSKAVMVAMVVHELPVITEINAQMMQVDARKKLGWIICIP